jgi:nucleoside-diphosphate-sugar epimerase
VRPVVTITGGSGFVGRLLCRGLDAEGWRVQVYDPYRGPLVDLVRRRYLATASTPPMRRAAARIRSAQQRTERALVRARLIRATSDDILADREQLTTSFAGSTAVVHLAGIPHPDQPGATDADFVRLNYDASVNVFEAARDAGVATFVFASSAQIYRINDMIRVDQFPILESNPLPLPAEGQSTYGFLKAAFERYLDGRCTTGPTRAVSLRLEYPGFRSTTSANFYVSTSIENLVAGFACALRAPDTFGHEAFNLCDPEVDPSIVDVQAYLAHRWPYVPNRTTGNASLLSTEKARRELEFRPVRGGRHFAEALVW